MKWKRAGAAGSSVSTLLFVIAGITLAVVLAAGIYQLSQRGADKTNEASNGLAQTLWGGSAPSYNVIVDNGQGTIRPLDPSVGEVNWQTETWPPTFTFKGTNFGNQPSNEYTALQVHNLTRGWTASERDPEMMVRIGSWQQTRIAVSAWQGYGGSKVFAPNDSVSIIVRSSGKEATIITTYPSDAPMPTVSMANVGSLVAGKAITVTGNLTHNWKPLAGEEVNFEAGATRQLVKTDGNGAWSVTFTPADGELKIRASFALSTAEQTITVVPDFSVTLTAATNQTNNNVTLTATVNQPLNGYRLVIQNQSTGQVVASTREGKVLTAEVTARPQATDSYVAFVER